MRKKEKTVDPELIGLLTAISIVSKRLAQNLSDLERRKERENQYACGIRKRPASGV